MEGRFTRIPAFLAGVFLSLAAVPAMGALQEPLIGQFNRSSPQFHIYSEPSIRSPALTVVRVEKGQFVRLIDSTPEYRWYFVEFNVGNQLIRGWVEGAYFFIVGKESEVGYFVERQRQQAEAQRRAIEEANQRVEAERLAREAEKAEVERFLAEAVAREKAQQQRLLAEREQNAREQTLLKERQRQEELRQQVEARAWAERLTRFFPPLCGAFFLLLFVPPYRHYAEYRFSLFSEWGNALLVSISGLFLVIVVVILVGGYASTLPFVLLTSWIFSVPALYFLPGAVWMAGVFIHSLFVPHPMEASLRELLRTGNMAEAERLAERLYNAERDGLPSDWRIKSRLWRLDRLNKMMEREIRLAEMAAETLKNRQKQSR